MVPLASLATRTPSGPVGSCASVPHFKACFLVGTVNTDVGDVPARMALATASLRRVEVVDLERTDHVRNGQLAHRHLEDARTVGG